MRKVTISTSLATIIFSLHFLTKKITDNTNRTKIIKNRLLRCLFFAHTVFIVFMMTFVCKLFWARMFHSNLVNSSIEKPVGTVSDYTIENHKDELMLLDESKWYYLSVNEKINVLQVVANIEAEKLGLSNELNVGVDNLEKESLYEGTQGYYNDLTHTIAIDILNTNCGRPQRPISPPKHLKKAILILQTLKILLENKKRKRLGTYFEETYESFS